MILFSILTLLVVVGIGIALSLTVLFKVDSIAVTGESRYTQEQILAECGLELGENLFLADTESARSVLESRLPYLEDVSVSRKLPSGIVISVSDASPSAVIAVEEGYLLVSARGKALEVLPSAPGGLPLIKGAQLERAEPGYPITYADEQTERALEEIIATLEKLEFGGIGVIDLSNPLSIELEYDGRILIEVGLPSDLDYKLKFAQKVLRDEIGADEKGTLDISLATDMDAVYFKEEDPFATESSAPSSSEPEPSSEPSSESPSEPSSEPESSAENSGAQAPEESGSE